MIPVNELIKGEKYINPNTGTEMIFDRFKRTEKNTFAIDEEGFTHIAHQFKAVNN